jgi:hypothetical protein
MTNFCCQAEKWSGTIEAGMTSSSETKRYCLPYSKTNSLVKHNEEYFKQINEGCGKGDVERTPAHITVYGTDVNDCNLKCIKDVYCTSFQFYEG